ncbi:MAG: DUF4214 domain-containing protein [Burkholderiales bacterium]|nr:DUF4214 domain-containing protein [Burkholderiales bacterium]
MSTLKPTRNRTLELDELLVEDGEEFVEAAYQALLKRRPDATGGRIYLRALRSGTSKLRVLYELSLSDDCIRAGGDIPGLQEAFARAGIGVAVIEPPVIAPPGYVLRITRAEQLLLLASTDEFIEATYWVLLKRAPDAEGIENYRLRMQDGVNKEQILSEIFTSDECRGLDIELPGLRDTLERAGIHVAEPAVVPPAPALPAQPEMTLATLLDFNGIQFVESAYAALLKRAPDEEELQHRLGQLLEGTSKIQILDEMSASQEVILAGAKISDLSPALRRYRSSQASIIGKIFSRFVDVERNSESERRGRATEQRLLILEAKLIAQHEQVERFKAEIAAAEQRASARRQDSDARIASLEKSVLGLRQLIEQVPTRERVALDLRSEEIVRDLKNARKHS